LNDDISDKDKKDWQTFISGKEKLHDKDFKVLKNNKIKTRSIDLHGYTLACKQCYRKIYITSISRQGD
jgi:hypothetical protein